MHKFPKFSPTTLCIFLRMLSKNFFHVVLEFFFFSKDNFFQTVLAISCIQYDIIKFARNETDISYALSWKLGLEQINILIV